MSVKANKTLIGAFVLGALALVILAVGVIGSGSLFSKPVRYVMFFDSSLKGLSQGSPVTFKGVPIGRVVEIRMVGDVESMQFRIPVYVDMNVSKGDDDNPFEDLYDDPENLERMKQRGLRARLNSQSLLTGQLLIEMDFFDSQAKTTPDLSTKRFGDYLIIPSIPSQLETIWQRLAELPIDDIADNLLTISERINDILNVPGLKEMPGQVNEALTDARLTMLTLQDTLTTYKQLGGTLSNVAQTLDKASPETIRRADALLGSYNKLAAQLETTMKGLGTVIGPNTITVVELNRTLKDVSDAARAVRALAAMLEREPEALLRGKGDGR